MGTGRLMTWRRAGPQANSASESAHVRDRVQRAALSTLVAGVVVALAVVPAVEYSRCYHQQAAYHWDAAGYRWGAVETYRALRARGVVPVVGGLLRGAKDSLDVSLRVITVPKSLTHRYGHLVTAVPILWLFLFLLASYVLGRTGSAPLALLACTPVLTFPLLYRPYLGLADCLPETSAVGLLGTALVCWLRSERLSNWRWASACGLALGLLAWQRTVWVIFAAPVFFPLTAVALLPPPAGRRGVWGGFVVFLLPPPVLCCGPGAMHAGQG